MKVKDKWKRGLPYVGNKGQKVEQIMESLPNGKRFVDVFGGGGCVSLTAASSGKYEEVIYNDRRKTVVELLRALVNDEPHFNLMDYVALTREQFFDWRDNQPDSIERTLVLIAYSFSNNQSTYLWNKKNEEEKLLLTRALFYGNTGTEFDQLYSYSLNANTISEKYRLFHKWRREQMNISSRYDLLQQLQQLEQLERLQQLQQLERLQQLEQLQQLERLQRLQYSVNDYRELVIDTDDVVYCDPPYVGTQHDYGGFDHKAFENWYLHECPAKEIYISEYTKLPHTEVAFNFGKKTNFSAAGKRRDELLLRVVH
ncbi:DNA adenine methylase (plasmid) [Levilactobacillus namurensis]|uniref:DNA adenine methylase n=1 Tax=Levilactobacillus namurensis TaxID=380393 RepID=UPI0028BE37C8|nr:DNA adenine methylase [Levilactobacillus namurensis]WNN66778.1 DNA adenine methylase [Levilactobacillus namurensis]